MIIDEKTLKIFLYIGNTNYPIYILNIKHPNNIDTINYNSCIIMVIPIYQYS